MDVLYIDPDSHNLKLRWREPYYSAALFPVPELQEAHLMLIVDSAGWASHYRVTLEPLAPNQGSTWTTTTEGLECTIPAQRLGRGSWTATVNAINRAGEGPDYWIVIDGTTPGPAANGTTTQTAFNEVSVSWSPPHWTGTSPISGYRLWWNRSGSWTDEPQAVVPATQTSRVISGLQPGTHTFRVVAVNGEGQGPPNSWTFDVEVVTVLPGEDWMDIRWWNESAAASYVVQWKSASESGWSSAEQVTAAAGATTHSVTGLTAGETYTARVQALGLRQRHPVGLRIRRHPGRRQAFASVDRVMAQDTRALLGEPRG